MKRYHTSLNKKGLKYNIGSYILLFIITAELILMIYFIVKAYNFYINYIKENVLNCEEKINSNNNDKNIKTKYKRIIKTQKKISSMVTVSEIQNNPKVNKILKKKRIIKNIPKNNFNNKKIENLINSSDKQIIDKSLLNNEKILENKEKILEKEEKNNKYNDYELNNLSYEQALKIDKRLYCQYYISLLKYNQQLIFTFYTSNDYNSKIIKICLFLFLFSLYYVVNTLFFNYKNIHIIYINKGIYTFLLQLPQINGLLLYRGGQKVPESGD